jgi:uncharacterized protein (TIGR02246 family)
MKGLRAMIVAAFVVLFVAGCGGHAVDTQSSVRAIRDLEATWNEEFAARDVDKVVSHYADDAILMAPGMTPLAGKQDIHSAMAQMIADPAMTLKWSPSRIDIAASGDIGYSQGSYLMTLTDPRTKKVVHSHGSYVTTFRHETDGTWKAVTDISTPEEQPAS